MNVKQTPRRLAVLLSSLALMLGVVSACGTSNGKDVDSNNEPADDQQFDTAEEYQIAFAGCLREQGIDIQDPGGDGLQVESNDEEAMAGATKACRQELGEPPAMPDDGPTVSDEEQQREYLKIAACFRSNGIDVPDPESGSTPDIPEDAPEDVAQKCAPDGIGGPVTGNGQ